MTGYRAAVLLGLGLAGCDSRALVVGDGAVPSDLAGGSRFGAAGCPDGAAARAADPECWPTRHVGRWRGFITGDARYRHVLAEPLELPSGEVLLTIEPQGAGAMRFGSDAAAAACGGGDAGAAYPLLSSDGGASSCSGAAATDQGGPRRGLLLDHDYALEGLSMSGASEGERRQDSDVTFSLTIAEPWRELCGDAPLGPAAAPCSCSDAGCSASAEALLISLSLSRDGGALRGTLTSSSALELVAGLELIRL